MRAILKLSSAACAVVALGAPPALAAVSHHQRQEWKRVDAPLAAANDHFLRALSQIRSRAAWNSKTVTAAQVEKPCHALAPAIENFDTAAARIGLTGAAGRDLASVISLNRQLVGLLTNMTVSEFIPDYDVPGLITPWPTPLASRFAALQSALAHDLGLPSAQVQI